MSGAQPSSFPSQNILFDAASGQALQRGQMNALLQQEKQAGLADADTERVARLSNWMITESGGDETKMASLYSSAVAEEQRQGRLMNAPAFPGAAGIRRAAAMGTSSEKQAEQRGVAGAVNAINLGNRPGTPSTPGATTPGPGVDTYEGSVITTEGTGRNPRSSATGTGQFIDSTWRAFAEANPQHFQGMTPEQVMAARSDPNLGPRLGQAAVTWLAQQNAPELKAQGVEPSGTSLRVAHWVGAGPAAKIMQAPDQTPVSSFLSPEAVAANPELATMTAGQMRTRFANVPNPSFLQPPQPGRVQVASVTPTQMQDATTTPPTPGQQQPAQTPQQQQSQQQTATTTQQPQPQRPREFPPDLQTNEMGLTANDLEALKPQQKLAATGNRAAVERFQNEIQQRQNANRTAQQQWLTHQDTLDQQAQQRAHQAETLQIQRGHLDLAKDANRLAQEKVEREAKAAGETFVPGTGLDAVHENTLQKYAAKMARGEQLTDDEQRLYDGAYYASQQSGGQSGVMTDPNNPGQQIPYQTTRRLAPSLPEPKGGALPAVISQPGAATKAPMTVEQGRAATFAGRMHVATPVMDDLDDITTYKERGLERAGKYVGYNLNSPEYQRLRVAQEAFLSGVIRKDSGAAVNKDEWDRYAHLYFPMPGDDVKTLELKKRIRAAEMEGMTSAAGPGYKPPAKPPDGDSKPTKVIKFGPDGKRIE